MNYYYIPNAPIDAQQEENLESKDSIMRRRNQETPEIRPNVKKQSPYTEVAAVGTLGSAIADASKNAVWTDLSKTLGTEFDEIRNDPELRSRQMDQLIRTYDRFVEQTGNPVEYFQDKPGTNSWAAGQLPNGDDVVWWDSTAPHAAVMAHELGHVNMNHANPISDPLAGLQTSGIGRFSGTHAGAIGAGSAALGAILGRLKGQSLKSQLIGTGVGGALGTVGGSGQFAYELGGASGRALDYLPDDYDKSDASGDLIRAGMTYGMAGPATAAVSALGAGTLAAVLSHPRTRRFAGDLFKVNNEPSVRAGV